MNLVKMEILTREEWKTQPKFHGNAEIQSARERSIREKTVKGRPVAGRPPGIAPG